MARRTEQAQEAFPLLLTAAEFLQVAAPFDNALVAEVHRYKGEGPAEPAVMRPKGHAQHAPARAQHAAAPTTPSFHEVLHGEAVGEEMIHVALKDCGVERVSGKFTAHEKRPAAP